MWSFFDSNTLTHSLSKLRILNLPETQSTYYAQCALGCHPPLPLTPQKHHPPLSCQACRLSLNLQTVQTPFLGNTPYKLVFRDHPPSPPLNLDFSVNLYTKILHPFQIRIKHVAIAICNLLFHYRDQRNFSYHYQRNLILIFLRYKTLVFRQRRAFNNSNPA